MRFYAGPLVVGIRERGRRVIWAELVLAAEQRKEMRILALAGEGPKQGFGLMV